MKKLLCIPFSGIKSPLCLLIFILCSVGLSAQSISGTVKSTTGEPLVGAAVLVKGTTNSTLSDTDWAISSNSKNIPSVFLKNLK